MSRSGSNGGGVSGSGHGHFGPRQTQQPTAAPPVGGIVNPPYTWHASRRFTSDPTPQSPYLFNDDDKVAFSPLTQRPSAARSDILSALTSKSPTSPNVNPPMSMAVLTLIIVASLCLVVGAIYLLIYFKSIKPMSARSRSYADPGGGKGDDDGGARKSAGHPFFRRK